MGSTIITESHSHWLYLGLLHLFESTSFLFQPVRRKQRPGRVSRHGTVKSSLVPFKPDDHLALWTPTARPLSHTSSIVNYSSLFWGNQAPESCLLESKLKLPKIIAFITVFILNLPCSGTLTLEQSCKVTQSSTHLS